LRFFDQTKPSVDSTEAQQQEEDEFQLALALSLSQEEADKVNKYDIIN